MKRSTEAEETLDNPIWAALTTTQANLGEGDRLARRFHPDVGPFAAFSSVTPAALQALHKLLLPHEQVAMQSVDDLRVAITASDTDPTKLKTTHIGMIHQMIATHDEAASIDDHDVIHLSHADVSDMLELVQKAKPGPFGKRTREMGNYIGIRDQGRLVAMAGERMRFNGYVEISAVCVDEEWRGKGIAGRLVKILRREIEQRGETPFLHVFSHNHSAISLYERLGFKLRRAFYLTRIGHADTNPASAP